MACTSLIHSTTFSRLLVTDAIMVFNLAVFYFLYTWPLLISFCCLLVASSAVSVYTCIIFCCMIKYMDWIFFFSSVLEHIYPGMKTFSVSLANCLSFSVSGILIDHILNGLCLLHLYKKGFMPAKG